MKRSFLFAAIAAFSFVACNNSGQKENSESKESTTVASMDTTKLKAGDTFYQCEMDPDVLSDKPGTCPKCGMELQKMTKK